MQVEIEASWTDELKELLLNSSADRGGYTTVTFPHTTPTYLCFKSICLLFPARAIQWCLYIYTSHGKICLMRDHGSLL